MGRAPCCDKANVKKGPWSPEEDAQLKEYIEKNGTGANWIALPQKAGLRRCGKSCRLRWLNYLRPNLKHGEFSDQEDRVICSLFSSIGSRWSVIAAQLPGRTDNDIKNYWNTKLKKKLMAMAPSTEYRKRPHRANSLLLQTSSMASPSPYECGGNFTYITTPNIAFSRENITNPNFTTVISPNVSTQDGEFVGPPMNIEVKDGKNNSLIFGGDENLCSFQNYLMSNNGVGEDQEHEKLLISSTNDGCFSTENPLDYSIEEIKQLISSTNYNVCNNNLNFFVDDMMIKTEEENVLDY